MIVWGGDVKDVEPYSTGLKLNATTYPFVAFIALHPVRNRTPGTGGGTPQNIMSVLSRNAGAEQTTPQALIRHMQDKLLPHMRPVFERYKLEEQTRVADRRAREDSEQRAREAELRDSERIWKKREERERKEREAEQAAIELKNMISAKERQKLKVAARRAYWRQVGAMIGEPHTTDNTRISIRLPDGKRATRKFGADDSVGDIYTFVAGHLADSVSGFEEEEPPNMSYYDVERDGWGFMLATSYPRVPITWTPGSQENVSTVGGGVLKNGAMLVVEMDVGTSASSSRTSVASGLGTGDDEYLSEED